MGCLLVSAVLEERHRSTLKAAQMSLGGERLRAAAPWAPFAALWWLVAPGSSEQEPRSYGSFRKESQAIALGKIFPFFSGKIKGFLAFVVFTDL